MKVAIVTWTMYSNYGTYLQSYALQKYIEELGYENYIISDRLVLDRLKKATLPDAQNEIESKVSHINDSLSTRLNNLLRNPKRLKRMLLARIDQERYQKPYIDSRIEFDRFRKRDLKILELDSYTEIEALNEQFDVFVCGSDQIWSVFESRFNPYYFLDFVKGRKIAYGPSLGTDRIPEVIKEKLKKLLEDFSEISVREEISAKQLSSLTGKEIKCVVDPTLLWERDFWEKFSDDEHTIKRKYLLCYFLENKIWYFTYAKKLAKRLGLKIVLFPSLYEFINSEYVIEEAVSPKKFVSWIRNASYVVTDSYHGCIFSMIFEKNYCYLQRFSSKDPFSQNIRIQSLFSRLNIMDRIIDDEKSNISAAMEVIDYAMVNIKIKQYRNESEQYLQHALKL